MTQQELSRLLGVHAITVSRWERGALVPNAYTKALLGAADLALRRTPDVGDAARCALAEVGAIGALYIILRAAFGPKE